MQEIREYKPLALVFYIDGNGNRNALPLDDTKRQAFKQAVEEKKMIELEGTIINTYDIKEIRPANKTTELEKYFYSRTAEERAHISKRVRNRAQNQKVNVLEWISEFGEEKAINIMQGWLDSKDGKPIQEEKKEEPKVQLTEEQRAEMKEKFKNLLLQYNKKHD